MCTHEGVTRHVLHVNVPSESRVKGQVTFFNHFLCNNSLRLIKSRHKINFCVNKLQVLITRHLPDMCGMRLKMERLHLDYESSGCTNEQMMKIEKLRLYILSP